MPRMFRYVFVLVCLTIIASASPGIAGAYTVQAGDTPVSIAKKHGISVEELLKANKSVKPNKIRVGETLNIPGAAGEKDTKKHPEGQAKAGHKTEQPTAKERASETKERESKTQATAKAGSHTVKKGETLGEIASKFGVSVNDLLKANKGLDARKIKVGQELNLPGSAKAEKTAEPAKTPAKAEKAAPAKEKESTKTYTAHRRDTPASVARKHHISLKELARLNPDMGHKLHSGQKLTVPAGKTRSAAEESAPEAEPETAPQAPTRPAATPPAAAAPVTVPEAAPEKPAKPSRPTPSEAATPSLPDTKEVAEAEIQFEKGIEFGKQNKFAKAVESFDKAIKLNSGRADYYASRGHANYYMKQYNKAIDDYTRAIEKNPNFALAYSMRGLSRTRSGKYPQAIEDFNKAIALGPNEADYYKGRGFTYLHLKQSGPMCQDYKKACDLGDCELLESARKEKACP